MPADELASGDDSAKLARYNELKGKADMLIGQHYKLLEIIQTLDAAVEDLHWQGVRANRFRQEWGKTKAALSGWAGKIAFASKKISDEAENYRV
jgi:transposase